MSNNIDIKNLRHRWESLCGQYTSDTAICQRLWTEIRRKYSGIFRHYHNLEHIEKLLEQAGEYRDQLSDPDVVEFAIWYHDAVFNVFRSDNEERSAQLAEKRLRELGLPEDKIEKCRMLILATKEHEVIGIYPDDDIKWMIDFDLRKLGSSWEEYSGNGRKIRKEFFVYPGFIYWKRRREYMKRYLDKERIYKTNTYYRLYESKARENISRDLDL